MLTTAFPPAEGENRTGALDAQTGQFIGIMDPSLAFGTIETPTSAVYRAFDLIRYDVVPEPSSVAGLSGGLLLFAGRRAGRRRERIR